MVLFFRRVLLTTDHTGAVVQIYARHLCRVAGAGSYNFSAGGPRRRWSDTYRPPRWCWHRRSRGGCSARSPPRTSSPASGKRRHRPRPAPRHVPFWTGGPARNSPRAGRHRWTRPSALCSPLHLHRREETRPSRRTRRITLFLTLGAGACTPPTWRRPPQKSSCGRPGAAGGHTASGPFTGSPRRRGGRPGAFGVFPTGVKRRHRVRQRRRRPRPLLPARDPPTRSRRRARPAEEKLFAHPFGLRRLPASLHRRAGTSSFCSALFASSHPCTRPSPAWPGSPWHRPP